MYACMYMYPPQNLFLFLFFSLFISFSFLFFFCVFSYTRGYLNIYLYVCMCEGVQTRNIGGKFCYFLSLMVTRFLTDALQLFSSLKMELSIVQYSLFINNYLLSDKNPREFVDSIKEGKSIYGLIAFIHLFSSYTLFIYSHHDRFFFFI